MQPCGVAQFNGLHFTPPSAGERSLIKWSACSRLCMPFAGVKNGA